MPGGPNDFNLPVFGLALGVVISAHVFQDAQYPEGHMSSAEPDKINELMKLYTHTGRIAFRYKLKKRISLNGLNLPEKEAITRMTETVKTSMQYNRRVI